MISSYQKQRAKSKLLEDPKNPKNKSPGMMRVVKSLRFPNIRKRKLSMVSLRNIIRTIQTENMMMTDLCISFEKNFFVDSLSEVIFLVRLKELV